MDALASDAARTIALQMLQERGRGAVLVGAARVDAALESLLQAVLLPAAGANDTFFQPDRPLGSFGARITLAACLGLIEPPVVMGFSGAIRQPRHGGRSPQPLLLQRGPRGSPEEDHTDGRRPAGRSAGPHPP